MKKLRLCFLFIILSNLLLLVQIGIYQFIAKDFQQFPMKRGIFSNPIFLKNLASIASLADERGIPLIAIDPAILIYIYNGTFRSNGRILSLATFSQFINSQLSFIDSAKQLGFQVITVTSHNRRLLQHGYHVSIPLHHILIRWDFAIHITIVYEREMQYWWHGPLSLNSTIATYFHRLGLPTNWKIQETAWDKFEIYETKFSGVNLNIPKDITKSLTEIRNSPFVECNFSRAQVYKQLHGHDDSIESQAFKSDAWRLLVKAKKILDGLKIPFWLSSGTCLGYYRQCDIIPHSKDVDLGIWIKDYDYKLIPNFSNHGLLLRHQFGLMNDSLELSFQDGDIKLDIFFFYEESQYVWNGGTQARTGKKFKYIFPKFSLCWTEFMELKVRVPCNTEAYIVANYGPLWMTPVKIWDWKKSPPNVRPNGIWPEEEWPTVIRTFQLPNA